MRPRIWVSSSHVLHSSGSAEQVLRGELFHLNLHFHLFRKLLAVHQRGLLEDSPTVREIGEPEKERDPQEHLLSAADKPDRSDREGRVPGGRFDSSERQRPVFF